MRSTFVVFISLCVSAVASFDCEDHEIDVAIALDASGDVTLPNFTLMKTFVKNLLGEIDIQNDKVRASVVSFSRKATVAFYLDDFRGNKSAMDHAIDGIPYAKKETNLSAALYAMRRRVFGVRGDRPTVPNVGIIIIEGEPNINVSETLLEAQRLKDLGTLLYVICINSVTRFEMDKLPSRPLNKYMFKSSFHGLFSVTSHILDAFISCSY